ncbi:MAG: UDP-N-acetylglucosamine--N-acetylmuramyl-(pentapeptide) pyrophosphoryl-undecaprenol N-acetylglucosamine transferase, partial [Verrucomicrobia bacterium]
MSRFLLACGGTGGHLSPGIALAEELVSRGNDTLLLVSTKKVDERLGSKYPNLRFEKLAGRGLSLHPARLPGFLASQVRGFAQARAIVREYLPDFIVGFGGFTTAVVAFAGRLGGVPVALHEANRVPGRAIRLAGHFARRVYLPPGVKSRSLSTSVVRHCGLPVRREFVRTSRVRARVELGLDPNRRTLAVLGGSQGATALNKWAGSSLTALARAGIQMVVVTGPGKASEARRVETPGPDGASVLAVFMPFCDDMPRLLSAADLAVSRAGAGTIAELVRMRVPAILIPYPTAADDHQRVNARYFEQQGGGFAVDQDFIGDLSREVIEVMGNEWLLQQFRNNLQRLDREDPAAFIADDLERLIRTG